MLQSARLSGQGGGGCNRHLGNAQIEVAFLSVGLPLEDTQVGYISQKYSLDKYILHLNTLGKYTLGNYTLGKYAFGKVTYDGPTDGRTYGRTDFLTWVGATDTCVSKNQIRYQSEEISYRPFYFATFERMFRRELNRHKKKIGMRKLS